MGFEGFHGNPQTVRRLREMLAAGRLPHALILAGPEGAGKYTLALMLARAMNCASPVESGGLPDFCGRCSDCTRIAESEALAARMAEAVEAREAMRETDKKETRLFVQTHPEVLVVPPDPPQMLIKVGQVRQVIHTAQYAPEAGRRRVYIFTESSFMKEAANSLLKLLEEPPPAVTLLLLTENPGELLPTIRSRCVTLHLSALPAAEVEAFLARERKEWAPRQRQLVARLSGGAIGKAKDFDLAAYTAARKDALLLLRSAAEGGEHSELFRMTDSYRSGPDARTKTDAMLRASYSLLQDLLYLQSGMKEQVRNTDIAAELEKLAQAADFEWLAAAAHRLGQVESGMRRNLLRNLSLDAFAVGLER